MFVLMHYVRASGLCNMYTERVQVLLHAQCFGIYIGLLRHPEDYLEPHQTSCWLSLTALYDEFLQMSQQRASRFKDLASYLPYDSSQAVLELAFFMMRWTGKEIYNRLYRHLPQEADRMREASTRLVPLLVIRPLLHCIPTTPPPTIDEQRSLVYGIAEFRHFLEASESNRTQLAEAVAHEMNVIVDMDYVRRLLAHSPRQNDCWSSEEEDINH